MSNGQPIDCAALPDRCGSTITVNGKTHTLPPGPVSILNGKIIVNGVAWTDADPVAGIVALHIHGDPLTVVTEAPVTVHGNVQGDVRAGGSVTCKDVAGTVAAGGSVQAGRIEGNAVAGGSIRFGG